MQLVVRFSTSLFFLFVAHALMAQPLPQYSAGQRSQQALTQRTIQQFRAANYQQALAEAQRLNRPTEERRPDGTVLRLRGISSTGELLYDATHSTTRAGISTHTSALYAGGSLGLSLSGSTLKDKLAIWDGGKVLNTHVEFTSNGASRVKQEDNATTLDVHATHVAGILMAGGVNPQVRGMAFGTNLRAYDFNNDDAEMSAIAGDLLVSNHSYGAQAGWIFNDSRTGSVQWEWWGDTTVSPIEDYKFGFYNSDARSWDQIAQNAPYYLIVKSAGNSHGSDGPGAGQPYYLGTSRVLSSRTRNNQQSYDQISTYGNCKNILSVGAVSNLSNGYNQPSDIRLASFSSWGPTDDGRIKPDIVGVGVSVLSSSSDASNAYATLSGTSMSSPNVAGSVLLLQELFSQRNSGRFMRSSTLRGLVLHTADEAGDAPGPDYRFGWGLLDDEKAARVILNTDNNHLLDERTLTQGQSYTLPVVASGRGPLTVTICWTDPAGPASTPSAATLNDRTPKLINDLDIRLSDGSQTSLPWILDPANPANPATRGDNIRDNVEQIVIANPVPGRTYTLTVSHKGSLSGAKQDYGLLVSGIGGKAYCASAPSSSANSRITRVQFATLDQKGADGCTTYSDFLQTVTSVQAGQQIPLTVSVGTCGVAKNVVVKAFADWNLNGDFTDAGETLATSGVLTGVDQFTSIVSVPATLQSGQFVRLRLVATETTSPDAVVSCGTYGNGETQDYLLRIVQTANDVGAVALVSPETSFCSQLSSSVSVRLQNYGSADQRNVPVTVRITDASNTEITSLTGTVGTIPAFRQSLLTLTIPGNVTLTAGQTYRFAITTALGSDQNNTNNTFVDTRATAASPTNGLFTATRCGSDTAISLRNTGGGTAFWYNTLTGGSLLAAGNQVAVRSIPAGGQFYAVLNDFSTIVGPADKRVFTGGSYSGNFGPAPLLSTNVPLLLESARLYIATAGKLTFTVRKYDNTTISTVTLDVSPTRNQSLTATVNGQLVDDPDDQGAVYPLNLRIPDAGDYKITISYDEGASIFRSNAGVTGFPYQVKTQSGTPILTIKGSLFARTSTQTDTLTNAWYYFYNLKVRSLDCPGPQRTPVALSAGAAATATITADGSTSICQGSSVTLRANTEASLSYQWFLNGQTISGATSSTLAASASGNYNVQVANSCLPVLSKIVPVVAITAQTPQITVNGFTLTVNAVSGIQWLLNGVAIAGANSPSYAVLQTGRYSVRGNVNGCGEAVSNEVYLAILATEPQSADNVLTVYPNPATRLVTVSYTATSLSEHPATVQLLDLRGQPLRSSALQRDGKIYSAELDISNLSGGTFFVVIADDRAQRIRIERLQKQ